MVSIGTPQKLKLFLLTLSFQNNNNNNEISLDLGFDPNLGGLKWIQMATWVQIWVKKGSKNWVKTSNMAYFELQEEVRKAYLGLDLLPQKPQGPFRLGPNVGSRSKWV